MKRIAVIYSNEKPTTDYPGAIYMKITKENSIEKLVATAKRMRVDTIIVDIPSHIPKQINIDVVAENFMEWLISENYFSWCDDMIMETYDEIKEDLSQTYKVAPRLVNLLAEVFDR